MQKKGCFVLYGEGIPHFHLLQGEKPRSVVVEKGGGPPNHHPPTNHWVGRENKFVLFSHASVHQKAYFKDIFSLEP
jgi:hypothetical protein